MRRVTVIAVCLLLTVSCGTRKALMRQRESLAEMAAVQKRQTEQMAYRLSAMENRMRTMAVHIRGVQNRDSSDVSVRIEEEYDTISRQDGPSLLRRVTEMRGVTVTSLMAAGAAVTAGEKKEAGYNEELAGTAAVDSVYMAETVKETALEHKSSAGMTSTQSLFFYIGVASSLFMLVGLALSVFNGRSNGILTTIKKIFNNV